VAQKSLQCLAPFGRMVVYGAASGEVAQFTGIQLMYKNQAIIGYWLSAWLQRADRVAVAALALMQYINAGQLKVIVDHTFPLSEAADAHRMIAERKTTGKAVLLI